MIEGEQEAKGSEESFLKKRENFTLAIRKNNREEIFAKKRNLFEGGAQGENDKDEKYVVDSRFADYIKKYPPSHLGSIKTATISNPSPN
jgi:hypothetical protein